MSAGELSKDTEGVGTSVQTELKVTELLMIADGGRATEPTLPICLFCVAKAKQKICDENKFIISRKVEAAAAIAAAVAAAAATAVCCC